MVSCVLFNHTNPKSQGAVGRKAISYRVGNYSKPRVLKERGTSNGFVVVGIVLAIVGVVVKLLG